MSPTKPISQLKMPGLMAAQVFDGEWAVVSAAGKHGPKEANRIIAAYMAVNELLKSTL